MLTGGGGGGGPGGGGGEQGPRHVLQHYCMAEGCLRMLVGHIGLVGFRDFASICETAPPIAGDLWNSLGVQWDNEHTFPLE